MAMRLISKILSIVKYFSCLIMEKEEEALGCLALCLTACLIYADRSNEPVWRYTSARLKGESTPILASFFNFLSFCACITCKSDCCGLI